MPLEASNVAEILLNETVFRGYKLMASLRSFRIVGEAGLPYAERVVTAQTNAFIEEVGKEPAQWGIIGPGNQPVLNQDRLQLSLEARRAPINTSSLREECHCR